MKLRQDFGLPTFVGSGAGAGMSRNVPCPCPLETAAGASGPGGSRLSFAAFGMDTLSPERRSDYQKRLAELDAKWPPAPRANVSDFVNHIDYAVKLIGIDHVGISSDSDGGGIDGWKQCGGSLQRHAGASPAR